MTWQSLFLGFMLLFLVGCGEQLSGSKPVVGNKLDLQIQFSDSPSSQTYRYILAYSKTPMLVPSEGKFFLLIPEDLTVLPGAGSLPDALQSSPVSRNTIISYFYANYFSTISHLFQFSSGGAGDGFIVPTGNTFPSIVDPQLFPEHHFSSGLLGVAESGTTLKNFSISVSLDFIHNKPVFNEKMYFVFMTIDTVTGIILDQIDFNVENVLGAIKENSNINIITVSPANADIQSWKATIL
jgi:hypothetical protein